jgi:hypothetical protein
MLSGSDGWPDESKVNEIKKLARKNFKSVLSITTPYRRRRADGSSTWPLMANFCFYSLCYYVAMAEKRPFLFLEPDAVPLCEGWLQKIEAEYEQSGKKFMGSVLETNLPSENPSYLNGVAVYPGNALLYFDRCFIDFLNGVDAAFDLAGAKMTVPQAHPTRLIQHFWGTERDSWPTFKKVKADGDPYNIFTLENLYPEAVLFHRTKDSSLIDLLRAWRNEGKVKLA